MVPRISSYVFHILNHIGVENNLGWVTYLNDLTRRTKTLAPQAESGTLSAISVLARLILPYIYLAQVRNAQRVKLITFDVRFDQDMIDTKP